VEIRSFHDLIVWQKAMDLVVLLYKFTHTFPRDERFGLTSQLRRAAVSVPSNIAEGHCRNSTPQFLNHLSIAQGSLGELETQIILAFRLGYLNTDKQASLLKAAAEIGRLLHGLCSSLNAKQQS
jgi:four helix bundle protein